MLSRMLVLSVAFLLLVVISIVGLSVVVVDIVVLSVVMLSVMVLNVVVLSVVMLNAVMLSVKAPRQTGERIIVVRGKLSTLSLVVLLLSKQVRG